MRQAENSCYRGKTAHRKPEHNLYYKVKVEARVVAAKVTNVQENVSACDESKHQNARCVTAAGRILLFVMLGVAAYARAYSKAGRPFKPKPSGLWLGWSAGLLVRRCPIEQPY